MRVTHHSFSFDYIAAFSLCKLTWYPEEFDRARLRGHDVEGDPAKDDVDDAGHKDRREDDANKLDDVDGPSVDVTSGGDSSTVADCLHCRRREEGLETSISMEDSHLHRQTHLQ